MIDVIRNEWNLRIHESKQEREREETEKEEEREREGTTRERGLRRQLQCATSGGEPRKAVEGTPTFHTALFGPSQHLVGEATRH